MPLPTLFAGNANPTGPQLDADLAALGALTPIPCTITGTNALSLTPNLNTPTISAYANYMQFSGVVPNTNTGSTTAQVGSLPALTVYKDTLAGPVVLVGGELVKNCALQLMYDTALTAGVGGFHVINDNDVTGAATRLLSATATLTYSAMAGNTSQEQNMTVTGAKVGDSVFLGIPAAPQAGIIYDGRVSAANTVVVRAFNITTGTLTPTGGTYRATVMGFN